MNKNFSVFGLLIFIFSSGQLEPNSFVTRCLSSVWERLPHRPFRPLMMHWMMDNYIPTLKDTNVNPYSNKPFSESNIVSFLDGSVKYEVHDDGYEAKIADTRAQIFLSDVDTENEHKRRRRILGGILRDEIKAGRDTALKAELYNDFKLILFSLIAIICAHASVEGIAELFNSKYKKLSNLKKLPKSLLQRWFLMKEKLDSNEVQGSEIKVIRHGTSMIKRKLFIALILLCIFCRVDDYLGLGYSTQNGYRWFPLNITFWYRCL